MEIRNNLVSAAPAGMGGKFRYILRHSSLEPADIASQKSGYGSVVLASTL
jgi:hypothetical protein